MAVPINTQYGPILLAVCLNMILYGLLISQTYTYYLVYRKADPRLNKCLVVYVLLVESLHTALSIYMIYKPLVLEFGNNSAADVYPHVLSPIVVLMGAISLPTQAFVGLKIFRFQRNYWVGAIIGLFALMSFAGSLLSAVQITQHTRFSEKRALTMSAALWLTPGAAADMIISVSLSYSLYKRKTGLPSTDAVLSRIIRLTLQTGIVTSVAALLNLITLVAFPIGNSVNFIFNVTLMKTYSNFLLATMNARAEWTDDFQRVNGSILFGDQLCDTDGRPQPQPFVHSPNRKMSFIRNARNISIAVPVGSTVSESRNTSRRTSIEMDITHSHVGTV